MIPTLKPLGAKVILGTIDPPATPQPRTLVNHDIPLILIAPI